MPLPDLVPFPLRPINPDGTCSCGNPGCKRVGKHPACLWRDLKLGDEVPRPDPGAGVGLRTGAAPKGSGFFVVDIDNTEAADRWEELGGEWDTYTVLTPRGWHLYFQHPGFRVKTTAGALAEGIDIRGDGGFVCMAGSPHASGGTYTYDEESTPAPQPAPPWLLDWLRALPAPEPVQTYPGDVTGRERDYRRERYADYLKKAPICIQGAAGDETLFKVVQVGAYDMALPVEDVLDLISEHYDPRCLPPWGEELDERVIHKAHSAKNQSTRPRNAPLLEVEAGLAQGIGTDIGARSLKEALSEDAQVSTPSEDQKPSGGPVANPDLDCGFSVRWGGWSSQPTPPIYLVDGLLMESKVSMIFAEPGSIKSWTAIDLAASVSCGSYWLGERATKKGNVLYVDFEDGEHEFHRRIHVVTGGGERPGLGYLYSPGNIAEEEFWLRLGRIQKNRKISLFVIDTLAGGSPGIDENDRNAALPLTYAGQFTEATGATILFLHHANRSGGFRGTSAYQASVDTLFKLETISDEDGTHKARLSCTKSGQKKVPSICLEFTDQGLRRFEDVPKEDPKEAKKDKRTLQELKAEILLQLEANGPVASLEMLRAMVKAKSSSVSACVAELTECGDVVKMDDGWVRDREELRRERLRGVITENPDWSRGKVLAHAFVSAEYFEKCEERMLLGRRSKDTAVVGYLWLGG